MKTVSKYAAIVLTALQNHEPVAKAMRRAGYSEKEIRSCQGRLKSIRFRLAPEDEDAWKARKRLCYIVRRRAALERLESGRSSSEHGDLQLIEAYDRALAQLNGKEARKATSQNPQETDGINRDAVDLPTFYVGGVSAPR